jgi:hypothetical protein
MLIKEVLININDQRNSKIQIHISLSKKKIFYFSKRNSNRFNTAVSKPTELKINILIRILNIIFYFGYSFLSFFSLNLVNNTQSLRIFNYMVIL